MDSTVFKKYSAVNCPFHGLENNSSNCADSESRLKLNVVLRRCRKYKLLNEIHETFDLTFNSTILLVIRSQNVTHDCPVFTPDFT